MYSKDALVKRFLRFWGGFGIMGFNGVVTFTAEKMDSPIFISLSKGDLSSSFGKGG
jgi:hypothetical protein